MANSKQNRLIHKSRRVLPARAPQRVIRASNPSQPGRASCHSTRGKSGQTKQAHVIALLERDTGATLDELIAATGWLPHTTRAALTGLRHKGFVLDRDKRADGTTVYRISSATAASSPSNAG